MLYLCCILSPNWGGDNARALITTPLPSAFRKLPCTPQPTQYINIYTTATAVVRDPRKRSSDNRFAMQYNLHECNIMYIYIYIYIAYVVKLYVISTNYYIIINIIIYNVLINNTYYYTCIHYNDNVTFQVCSRYITAIRFTLTSHCAVLYIITIVPIF